MQHILSCFPVQHPDHFTCNVCLVEKGNVNKWSVFWISLAHWSVQRPSFLESLYSPVRSLNKSCCAAAKTAKVSHGCVCCFCGGAACPADTHPRCSALLRDTAVRAEVVSVFTSKTTGHSLLCRHHQTDSKKNTDATSH